MDILNAIVSTWEKKIQDAKPDKHERFGKTAARAWKYYGQHHKFLYLERSDEAEDAQGEGFPTIQGKPYYKASINRTRDYVALYLPYLHNKVPHRQVEPSRPPIPPELMGAPPGMALPPTPLQLQDKQRAWLMEWWLNYLGKENDLRAEGRCAVIEALVKGRGLVWHSFVNGPYGPRPGSWFDTVDHLFVDPDCEKLRHASWIARLRRRPVWEVAKERDLPVDELKDRLSAHRGRSQSPEEQAMSYVNDEEEKRGDICVYYEVWSRCGVGQRFHSGDTEMKEAADALDDFGDWVYLEICPGVPYPLNLKPGDLAGPDLRDRLKTQLEWPCPYYVQENDPWPFSQLDFYPHPRSPWSSSPLEAALPLQAFLDYAYSFIMQRIRTTCRDIILASAAMQDELKRAILSGVDQEVVTVQGKVGQEDVDKLVNILKFPEVNKDLWSIIAAIEASFEKATGLNEIAYGGSGPTQMRSSAEAQIRDTRQSIRPEDMAECVEDWMSKISAKEALMTRLYVPAPSHLFGEPGQEDAAAGGVPGQLSTAWNQLVTTQDPWLAGAEVSYTVEAGTGRRKNKAKQLADMHDTAQYLLPALMGVYQTTGNPMPANAWFRLLGDAQGLDVTDMLLPMPPPPPPPGAPPPQGQPGQGPPPGQ